MKTLCSFTEVYGTKSCDGHPGGFDNISEMSCEFILTFLPIYTSFYFGIAKAQVGVHSFFP